MSEIRTIVVPLDGSQVANRVLPVVRLLAERAGADAVLVTSNKGGDGATAAGLEVGRVGLPGVRVRSERFDDRDAAQAAIDVTLAAPDRVLVMSTHARGGLRRALLGSVAGRVIGSGEVPLLLVGPECDPESALGQPGPIVLCIDGSHRSPQVVAAGRRWARLLDRDVQMVMIANPRDVATPQESDQISAAVSAPLEADGLNAKMVCLLSTAVPEALADQAVTLKAPLLVIAASARSTHDPVLVGSTTMAILGHAPCPVLVVPGAT